MNQLVISSTLQEIDPFASLSGIINDIVPGQVMVINKDLSFLLTGVGSPETIFHLTRLLSKSKFDRVIQVGIAGSYKSNIGPGALVEIKEEVFADLGIDKLGEFVSVFESGITNPNAMPFNSGVLINPYQRITSFYQARAVTVNTVSGSEKLIEQRVSKYNPDIESMEGAAAFYTCLSLGIPILQVRSISNYVEPRNRSSWKMEVAIQNLNKWLIEFVNTDVAD